MSNPTTERAIIDALITQLEEIDGLHGYAFPTANMHTPFFIPALKVDFNNEWGGRSGIYTGTLLIMTKIGTGTSGGEEMLDYIANTGAKSINAKLEEDITLGGVCVDVRCTGPTSDMSIVMEGEIPIMWQRFLGIEIYV